MHIHRNYWSWVAIALLQTVFCHFGWSASLTKLSISSNHRYLQNASGKPFLLIGDCPQNLSNKLAVSELDAFYNDCTAKGFNILWFCIDGEKGNPKDFVNFPPKDVSGQPMMNTPWKISTLNPAYFTTIDAIVDKANAHGIYLFMMPLSECTWTQANINKNTPAEWTQYGTFLGNRYKNRANIIWLIGNDNINIPAQHAIVNAIKATGDTHLMTVNWLKRTDGLKSSYKDVGSAWVRKYTSPYNEKWIKLDAWYQNWPIAQSGAPAYWTKVEYQRMTTLANTMPLFCIENDYQQPYSTATDLACRMQNYYAILGGACGGTVYGSGYLGEPRPGDAASKWDYNNYKNNGGRVQTIYFKKLMSPLNWTSLVPDYDNKFVTGGKGTLSPTTMNYVGAAVDGAGTLGMAYVPLSQTITVNMARFSGLVMGRWYDPTNGTFKSITGSPFANTGSHKFTTPGNNHAGKGDWVLLLEKVPA